MPCSFSLFRAPVLLSFKAAAADISHAAPRVRPFFVAHRRRRASCAFVRLTVRILEKRVVLLLGWRPCAARLPGARRGTITATQGAAARPTTRPRDWSTRQSRCRVWEKLSKDCSRGPVGGGSLVWRIESAGADAGRLTENCRTTRTVRFSRGLHRKISEVVQGFGRVGRRSGKTGANSRSRARQLSSPLIPKPERRCASSSSAATGGSKSQN